MIGKSLTGQNLIELDSKELDWNRPYQEKNDWVGLKSSRLEIFQLERFWLEMV